MIGAANGLSEQEDDAEGTSQRCVQAGSPQVQRALGRQDRWTAEDFGHGLGQRWIGRGVSAQRLSLQLAIRPYSRSPESARSNAAGAPPGGSSAGSPPIRPPKSETRLSPHLAWISCRHTLDCGVLTGQTPPSSLLQRPVVSTSVTLHGVRAPSSRCR